jgi:hypothetical protein
MELAGVSNRKKNNIEDQNKDFIANELKAISKLSLYDSADKINCDSEHEDCEQR